MTQQEAPSPAKPGRKKEKDESGKPLKRAVAALTSLAGIAAAIATITTSAATVLGVVVHSKNVELRQASTLASSQARQIQHQALQIHQLKRHGAPTASPSPSVTPSATITAGAPSAPVTGDTQYLSNMAPTVQNANMSTGQVVIATEPYVNSIQFDCDNGSDGTPDEAFDVAGSTMLRAEIGIPDDMQNATGVVATVTFSNEAGQQVGRQFQVSLGHPAEINLSIKGVTQLGMTCSGLDKQTGQPPNEFQIAMGNAEIS
jgi:hypothetical protein